MRFDRRTGPAQVGLIAAAVWLGASGLATTAGPAPTAPTAPAPALTIYNQQFAVVRETIPLDLHDGPNEISFDNTTAHLEPDSVILRDPTGARTLQILEQNYRADPISQELLLSLFEGKTIPFEVPHGDHTDLVEGKIIRSGYVPHAAGYNTYGGQYYQQQMAYASSETPIIEVNGKLEFGLPGRPLFPSLGDDTILKPTLHWTLETDKPGPFNAELAYVTGGMSWHADYNVVMPEKGDILSLIGWVTLDNQSGRSFQNAHIKLMAGDVNQLPPNNAMYQVSAPMAAVPSALQPNATEKAFDEYHLYTLQRPTTVRDRETKQVEFARGTGVHSSVFYVYDGREIGSQWQGSNWEYTRQQPTYGTQANTRVWVMREFKNSAENGLGIPLPKGRVRFYRQDTDGQLEFIGENAIDHTPKDETVRVYTGNAFDLVGNRTETNFKIDNGGRFIDESFEITLRNHKTTPVEIRVAEHLDRYENWKISMKSDSFRKIDAHTIEFPVTVAPNAEKVVDYMVHYTW